MKTLSSLNSVVNRSRSAPDTTRAYTYIEFVKSLGGDSRDAFEDYKEYLTRWARTRKGTDEQSNSEFVSEQMVEVLKSIALSYSSYEEQRFIANLDWSDRTAVGSVIPLFAKKIKEVTQFYRRKRAEVPAVVMRNSYKGSTKSVEAIVYEKIVDFVFARRNVLASYADIRRNLFVSIENYVDVYGDYFDYDRSEEKDFSVDAIDVDPTLFNSTVGDLLFSGNAHLKEIPLIAQMGLDLGAECVGDALALKDTLLSQSKIDQIGVQEAANIRRRLYQKYLGVDLYYIYCDEQKNITFDVLTKADNPTGNLLNVSTADTVTAPKNNLKLLSELGLFFKPDKISLLKLSAKDYTWTVDTEKLTPNTWYVFPDPDKQGDVGVNKSSDYPLVMTYKLDYDVRNLSAGTAFGDPLVAMADAAWHSYYSREDDLFRLNDNLDWSHAFTAVPGFGSVALHGTDNAGNEVAVIKDYVFSQQGEATGVPEEPEKESLPVNEVGLTLINGGYFCEPGTENTPFRFNFSGVVINTANDYLNRTGLTQESGSKNTARGLMFPPEDVRLPAANFALTSALGEENLYTDHYNYTL